MKKFKIIPFSLLIVFIIGITSCDLFNQPIEVKTLVFESDFSNDSGLTNWLSQMGFSISGGELITEEGGWNFAIPNVFIDSDFQVEFDYELPATDTYDTCNVVMGVTYWNPPTDFDSYTSDHHAAGYTGSSFFSTEFGPYSKMAYYKKIDSVESKRPAK